MSLVRMFLLFIFSVLTIFSSISFARGEAPKCPDQGVMMSGNHYGFRYANIKATTSSEHLEQVVNDIGSQSMTGMVFPNVKGALCKGFVLVTGLNFAQDGAVNIGLRVGATCTDVKDKTIKIETEDALVIKLIKQLEKVSNLSVDDSWSAAPPCVGGGVTGSN